MKTRIDRDLYNPDNYKLTVFYYNPKDKELLFQKWIFIGDGHSILGIYLHTCYLQS